MDVRMDLRWMGSRDASKIVAASALAGSSNPHDVEIATQTLERYTNDAREQAAPWRLQTARALGDVTNPAFRSKHF